MGKTVQAESNAITALVRMDENPQLLHIKKIQWVKDLKKEDAIMFLWLLLSLLLFWFGLL